MRKIITFLGDRGALQTTYSYKDNLYTGGVFAEALRQFCEYDIMLVCVTEKAKENTWSVLEQLNDSRIKPIDIPTGRQTDEMWQTFRVITECVDEGDSVVFDITHGLRSLPFLVFLFATYLKAAKNVTIEAIYYGALELGNSKNGVPAPVIDLSEFVEMLDWLTATNTFVEIGDGQALANLLHRAIPSSVELQNDPSTRPIRNQLKNAAEAIETISLALSVTRPIEAMKSATRLQETLTQSAPSFEQRAKPFALLAERVVKEYGQFALENPTDQTVFAKNIKLQLQMIEWYIQRDKVVQAVTLAREWLISVLVLQFGLEQFMFDNKKGREYVEKSLNNAVEKRKPNPDTIVPSCCDKDFEALQEADELAKLWGQIRELRNDIAHVGMNLDPKSAAKLKQKTELLYPRLQEISHALLPD
ncbi:MAG: TIGR02221 family CRISPR-associated protein [Stigonema ocellatum SAG 48.90 = DSM 106950]|nr:TIGR02221 family CRISPR-associated protein [Stigonema ocellatum SAG 48.90 = DSM 106950]